MNSSEMTQKLESYMMETGYYDTRAIARDFFAVDELTATFAAFFGTEDMADSSSSEEFQFAEAYNEEKYQADKAAARDENTADAIMTEMLSTDDFQVLEKELPRKTENMHDAEKLQLVASLIAMIDHLHVEFETPGIKYNWPRRAMYNRALDLLERMRLARELGDVADMNSRVDTSRARAFLRGHEKYQQYFATDVVEEYLAKMGL